MTQSTNDADKVRPWFAPDDVRVGDVIELPWGINRRPEVVTIHYVHQYGTGDLSVRFSFTSNPRGIDWSGFIERDDPDLKLLSRGVAAVRSHARSLLPAPT